MKSQCTHRYRTHNWFNSDIQERTCLLCGEVKEKEVPAPSPEIEEEIQAELRKGRKIVLKRFPEQLDPNVPPQKGDGWRSPDGLKIFDGENWVPVQIIKEAGPGVTGLDVP